jgi:hypothetical protein
VCFRPGKRRSITARRPTGAIFVWKRANQLREVILEVSKQRFVLWNKIAGDVRQAVIPFVSRKIAAVVRANGLPAALQDQVEWDIIHICMEADYADVVAPGFYARQRHWYIEGHFPCGWEGRFPAGRLIIY